MKVEACGAEPDHVRFTDLAPGDCFYGVGPDGQPVTGKPLMKVAVGSPTCVTPCGKILPVPRGEWVVKLDASWVIHGAV
jgi:hypothetical protein